MCVHVCHAINNHRGSSYVVSTSYTPDIGRSLFRSTLVESDVYFVQLLFLSRSIFHSIYVIHLMLHTAYFFRGLLHFAWFIQPILSHPVHSTRFNKLRGMKQQSDEAEVRWNKRKELIAGRISSFRFTSVVGRFFAGLRLSACAGLCSLCRWSVICWIKVWCERWRFPTSALKSCCFGLGALLGWAGPNCLY